VDARAAGVMVRTDQALFGGLPGEVAHVAAAAIDGRLITEGGEAVAPAPATAPAATAPAAAAGRLGRSALGGRLVFAHGDVAVAQGVACGWRTRKSACFFRSERISEYQIRRLKKRSEGRREEI